MRGRLLPCRLRARYSIIERVRSYWAPHPYVNAYATNHNYDTGYWGMTPWNVTDLFPLFFNASDAVNMGINMTARALSVHFKPLVGRCHGRCRSRRNDPFVGLHQATVGGRIMGCLTGNRCLAGLPWEEEEECVLDDARVVHESCSQRSYQIARGSRWTHLVCRTR